MSSPGQRFILVMSGKGGVGKSTVSSNLARALSKSLPKVGLLDLDLTGPSIPTMFGIQKGTIKNNAGKMVPYSVENIEIISIGLLLDNPSDPVIWRGPRKNGMINQFFRLIDWSASVVVVDMPPGTSDEHLATLQILKDNAIPYEIYVVTSPSPLSVADVRKGINLCKTIGASVSGLVENFCGVMCPCCNEITTLADNSAVSQLAAETGLPLVITLPFMPNAAAASDRGEQSDEMLKLFEPLVRCVLDKQ